VHLLWLVVSLVLVVWATGCGQDGEEAMQDRSAPAAGEEMRFPKIVEANANRTGDRSYDFSVTISSPYDSPDRYANGWRVLTPDGDVLGEHELAHDHANEQPFTREQTGVEVPSGVDEVLVEPRDLTNGYGGKRVPVRLP